MIVLFSEECRQNLAAMINSQFLPNIESNCFDCVEDSEQDPQAVARAIKEFPSENAEQQFIVLQDEDEERATELLKEFGFIIHTIIIDETTSSYKSVREFYDTDKQGLLELICNAPVINEPIASKIDGFKRHIAETANIKPISTGFKNLDNILGGGLYAGLYIIGAVSSLGKTTFSLQIADQIATSGTDVLIFSLEMATNELIAKSVSRLTYKKAQENKNPALAKTTRQILTGALYTDMPLIEKQTINACIEEYAQTTAGHIYIYEGVGNIGIKDIKKVITAQIVKTGRKPVVLIDYLQILAPYNERYTDKQNTDKTVLELKRLSRDFNIPVWAISSFNRDNYSEPVSTASFKESGAIEYTSDVLLGLQYDGMEYTAEDKSDKERKKRIRDLINQNIEQGKNGFNQSIQVKIIKNRNGAKGDCNFNFVARYNNFTAQTTEYDNPPVARVRR